MATTLNYVLRSENSRHAITTRISWYLKRCGKTMDTISKQTGIGVGYLQTLSQTGQFDGMRWPDDLVSFCQVLKISADDLLGLQEHE